jgi:CRP/FNR family transcriptional regulator
LQIIHKGLVKMIEQLDVATFAPYLPFWDILSEDQKELLADQASIATYSKGANIHHGQAECIGTLLVVSGRLVISLLSHEGRQIVLYRMAQGDMCILSASCILKQITFDVNIDAEEDAVVLRIATQVFAKLQNDNLELENFVYKITTERFSDVMWTIQQVLFAGTDKRIAMYLLDECARTNGDIIHCTHEQIARYIGSAREVVTRMLHRFSQEGIVSLSRGKITITDKAALRKIVH